MYYKLYQNLSIRHFLFGVEVSHYVTGDLYRDLIILLCHTAQVEQHSSTQVIQFESAISPYSLFPQRRLLG